ncbi:MAG: hypothetical protein FRX48_03356 [Lasallia pustulata]|nr:MAG: hypothetical protein FRX48_03356 [Lasallia pustulata]
MNVKCFHCGVLHTIEEDGSTEHRCAETVLYTIEGASTEHRYTGIRETPLRPWNEFLDAIYRQSLQPSSASNQQIGEENCDMVLLHPNQLDLTVINVALGLDKHGNGVMSLNNPNNMFPSFLDQSPTNSTNLAGMQRQAPSPIVGQHQANNSNGGGAMNGMNVGLPMNAGSQMDYNLLYQKVMELAQVLHENREETKGIVASAEELATRATANGATPSLEEANGEITAARIADLNRQISVEQSKVRILMREQHENTKLIGEYETAVGNIVEMVRNYSYNNNMEKIAIRKHYNKILQDEKDAHLDARLERDDWHAKFMRCVEMLRTAHRLRCDEEEEPTILIAGLQNEVRVYRDALGMEPEKFEDETGYLWLKDIPDGDN